MKVSHFQKQWKNMVARENREIELAVAVARTAPELVDLEALPALVLEALRSPGVDDAIAFSSW